MSWIPADGYKKRGLLYTLIAVIGLGYELLFSGQVRPVVVVLWTGLLGIGLIVAFTIRDQQN